MSLAASGTEDPALAWTAPNGERLALRRIRADDVERLSAFVRGLSYATRYFRYGHGDADFTREQFEDVCGADPDTSVHWLALHGAGEGERIVGSARAVFSDGSDTCELAIAVNDDWQAQGIGKRLIERLVDGARGKGSREIRARILATNRDMIDFMRHRGFSISDSPEGPWVKIAALRLR